MALVFGLFVLVIALVVLDFVQTGVKSWLDVLAKDHEVGVSLTEHLIVAALVAAVAYYALFGFKLQRALKRYRELSGRPQDLVEWSDGTPPVVRRRRAELLADAIKRSAEPAVAVVQGRSGTGRTSFIVGLVDELAKKKLIPIPLLANHDGSFEVASQAKRAFCKYIDRKVSSDQQADAIWRRARASRGIVILVDGIDEEIAERLSENDGSRFRKAIEFLGEQQISIVLATTAKLPLGDLATVREDLDLFTREEAEEYIEEELRPSENGTAPNGGARQATTKEAIGAISRLRDPVDESLVAPFYLELIGTLGGDLGDLPADRDRWRAEVLKRYLAALAEGRVAPRGVSDISSDIGALKERGQSAIAAAMAVAQALDLDDGELTVAPSELKSHARDAELTAPASELKSHALKHAVDFGLLWHGDRQIGFRADDLGAYILAETLKDPAELVKKLEAIAESGSGNGRHNRFVIMTLIFWHFQNEGESRRIFPIFRRPLPQLLKTIDNGGWTRPVVVAAAVRVANICNEPYDSSTINRCVERCIEEAAVRQDDGYATWRAELIEVVRALAGWSDMQAHRLLWRLATARNIDVEWPAAKTLALAHNNAAASHNAAELLCSEAEQKLSEAESCTLQSLSDRDDRLGNEIASLAWILPAFRDLAEYQFDRVSKLCLRREMSPLRGEMSLAQGLKLAVMNGRASDANVKYILTLLLDTDDPDDPSRKPYVRFWHARLILVQALLAYAWDKADDGSGNQNTRDDDAVAEIGEQLKRLHKRERHPLVLHAIQLSREGVRALQRPPKNGPPRNPNRYLWIHEREAVRWVGRGKEDVARLAADAVLLSNITYELRRIKPTDADRAAVSDELPLCIRRTSQRKKIGEVSHCKCEGGLCGNSESPVVDHRAPFSEAFCREQVRMTAQHGPPPWTSGKGRRSRRRLEDFWAQQATVAARASAERLAASHERRWPSSQTLRKARLQKLRSVVVRARGKR
jgi:hypothetical protein